MPDDPALYAHSLKTRARAEWEPLHVHLSAVAACAARYAGRFGWARAGYAAGLLHDIGKASAEFQAYIRDEGRSVDHSTAGAREAVRLYGPGLGRMLAYAVAGHHAGLADGVDLNERLSPANARPPAYDGWEAEAPGLPSVAEAQGLPLRRAVPPLPGFSEAFRTRMLFSCLVDADVTETIAFKIRGGEVGPPPASDFDDMATLAARLDAHLGALERRAGPGEVNALRARVLVHARAKASEPPGLFTLTVPTGGGKTFTSLAFALHHARLHGLDRVVYVIPFTSIVEQTASDFRTALGERNVLEHHVGFDWDSFIEKGTAQADIEDIEGRGAREALRQAAATWDSPIVVTTAVQFFESLFANRTSKCRKLHNLAGAVIVLDEAQTLPPPLLRPCLAALDELARNYGATVVLCTATQPAVRVQDRALVSENRAGLRTLHGLDIEPDRELAPDPPALYGALKRVEVEVLPGETDDATIATRFAHAPQMLCIVNSRAHARALFEEIKHLEGAVHLSTLMCPVHRSAKLAEVREALAARGPARVVSTSLIEAGVDISFPEVWRASTGLDSIAQSAGRCNRNDELAAHGRRGRVVVFTPPERTQAPPSLKLAREATASVLRRMRGDPLGLETVTAYFQKLYARRDFSDLDQPDIRVGEVSIRGVLAALEATDHHRDYPFRSIAEAVRLIDDVMKPVVVPYGTAAIAALNHLAETPKALAPDLRTLQRYTVGLPRAAYAFWVERGVVVQVRRDLGDALMRFTDGGFDAHYDDNVGVDISDLMLRKAEANIIS